MLKIPGSSAWQSLAAHHNVIAHQHMRDLFAQDPERFQHFSVKAAGIFLDYSKHRMTAETRQLLTAFAAAAGLPAAIEAMFGGQRINTTENRAVLHTALRAPAGTAVMFDGVDVVPAVHSVLERMRQFVQAVHTGARTGYTNKRITDVVNIGIGGSHLGPMMVCRALRLYSETGVRVHFVANVDGTDIYDVFNTVDPETVLFVVASKTFTTQETMANAAKARAWLIDKLGASAAVARHFVAVSTNLCATSAFGIASDDVFEFWDWVGGRYSLWSAIGLPIALHLGMDHFDCLRAGAQAMDRHFREAPFDRNIPVLLALLEIWYINFFGAESRVVAPYDQPLEYLPAYLQQLEMESNGKRVRLDGELVEYPTCGAVWGAPGTNGQHAFFQLLHQGTSFIPVDFLAPLRSQTPLADMHELLLANCFAQSEALMRGKNDAEVRAELAAAGLDEQQIAFLLPHKLFPGNRPSSTVLYEQLTPASLGALIAMYEHKVFTAGVLWGINSFDQWGVELGKQLANSIVKNLRGEAPVSTERDSSTRGLIEYWRTRAGRT